MPQTEKIEPLKITVPEVRTAYNREWYGYGPTPADYMQTEVGEIIYLYESEIQRLTSELATAREDGVREWKAAEAERAQVVYDEMQRDPQWIESSELQKRLLDKAIATAEQRGREAMREECVNVCRNFDYERADTTERAVRCIREDIRSLPSIPPETQK